MTSQAKKGAPHGQCPLGYVRRYDPKTRAFIEQVEDPVYGPLIRQLHARALAGESPHALSEELNERRIPKARGAIGRWDTTAVVRLLMNEAYIGVRVHRPAKGPVQRVKAVWPPLIDDEDFQVLRTRLSDPARRTNRGTTVKHLLTGLPCAIEGCQGRIRALTAGRSRGHAYRVYACSARSHLQRSMDFADAVVEAHVIALLSRPGVLRHLHSKPRQKEAKRAAVELKKLTDRLEEALDAVAAGELSAMAAARIEQQLAPQIEAAEQAAQRIDRIPAAVVELASAKDVQAAWDALSVEKKRLVIRTCFDVAILPASPQQRRDPSLIRVTQRLGR